MTPQHLKRPFIGIRLTKDDYNKVERVLPTPSYQDKLYSYNDEKIELIYEIDTFHHSSKEYKYLSDIKLGMMRYIFTPISFIDEFYIHDTTEIHSITYSLLELSNAFQCEYITYPKIFFPHYKKELYRHLILHGKKLRYERVFTKEAMIATALMMNQYLNDKMLDKEVHKTALAAYRYILEHKKNFKQKLSKKQRKEAHRKGATATNKLQRDRTGAKIAELLKDDTYIKPNGKVHKTALSKALNIHRRTLDKYL
jgi:hypothetical protein